MKWIKYIGPHDFVDVPRWQIGGAERGRPIEVSDEAAEDLLTQPANWEKSSKPRNVLREDADPTDADPLLTEPGAGADDQTAATEKKED